MAVIMRRTALISSAFFLFSIASELKADAGVPIDGFPNWNERMIHVLVNRARCDPAQDLAGCENCPDKDCYTPQPPLLWNEALAHVARFHATNLISSGCSLQHDSPCELESDIGTTYPATCDGSVSCACVGDVSICSGANNSNWIDRRTAFGISGGYPGENLAWFSGSTDPFDVFYKWLWEDSYSSSCEFSFDNGHRYNILRGNFTHIGVGQDGNFTVQEFWGTTAESQKIPSGGHYPQSGNEIEFRANWYDAQAPTSAQVNINGTLNNLIVERGYGGNITYFYETAVGEDCVQYFFRVVDAGGELVTYPSRGSFGINCSYDWTASRPGTILEPFPLELIVPAIIRAAKKKSGFYYGGHQID